MRKLQTRDLFSFCRCLRKIGIKEEVKKLATNANKVSDITENGFELIYRLFELATEKESEKELYAFLSDPFEMSAAEIETLGIEELLKGINEIAALDTWKLFFKQAAHSTK